MRLLRRFDYYCQERERERGRVRGKREEKRVKESEKVIPTVLHVCVCVCVCVGRSACVRACACVRVRAFRIATASRAAISAPPWPRSILSCDHARVVPGRTGRGAHWRRPEYGARHAWGLARASAHSAPNARFAHDSDGWAAQGLRTRNTQGELCESHVIVSMKARGGETGRGRRGGAS